MYDDQSTVDPKSSEDEKSSRHSLATKSIRSSAELNAVQNVVPACDEGYVTEGNSY